MQIKSPPPHFLHIDTVKSFAILSVIAIHAAAPALSGFSIGSGNWLAALFFRTLCAAAVPLFFMCTGALFFRSDRHIGLRDVWCRYIPRILLCLAAWSVFYEGLDLLCRSLSQPIGLADILAAGRRLLTASTHFHLYYLYIVLLVYALVPLLRDLLCSMSAAHLRYLLGLWAVAGLLFPLLRQFRPFTAMTGIPLQYPLNMTWSAAGYCILGHYLHENPPKSRLIPCLAAVSGFAGIFGCTVWLSLHRGSFQTVFLEGMTPFVALSAAGIFSFCRISVPGPRLSRAARHLARASFCIYLVHDVFNILLRALGITATAFTPLFSVPAICLSVLAGSLGVHAILSRIPVVKKWLI